MAAKFWKIALGVGCVAVLLAMVAVLLLPLGFRWLEAEMQRRAAEPLTAIELRECELVRDGGSVTVRGSLLNGGRGAVQDVSVKLRWTDGSESLITAGVGGLTPGGSTEFEHIREDPGGAMDDVACWIDCVRTEQARICR